MPAEQQSTNAGDGQNPSLVDGLTEIRQMLHDLRTPLTTVVGASSLIERSGEIADAHRLAGQVRQAAEQLDRGIREGFATIDAMLAESE